MSQPPSSGSRIINIIYTLFECDLMHEKQLFIISSFMFLANLSWIQNLILPDVLVEILCRSYKCTQLFVLQLLSYLRLEIL